MFKPISKPLLTIALLSGMLLSGCQTVSDEVERVNMTTTPLDAHPIVVTESRAELVVAAPAGAAGLSPADQGRIAEFAASYGRIGHGPVVMSVPTGGANSAAASMIASQVRTILYAGGVNWDAIVGGAYDGTGASDAPVTLSFVKFDAKGPDCPSLSSIDMRRSNDNLPTPAFGCSAYNNLAAQIADPADLLGEGTLDPVDAATRARVTKAYRDGTIKAPPSASASASGS